jgi:hypothetical protein
MKSSAAGNSLARPPFLTDLWCDGNGWAGHLCFCLVLGRPNEVQRNKTLEPGNEPGSCVLNFHESNPCPEPFDSSSLRSDSLRVPSYIRERVAKYATLWGARNRVHT